MFLFNIKKKKKSTDLKREIKFQRVDAKLLQRIFCKRIHKPAPGAPKGEKRTNNYMKDVLLLFEHLNLIDDWQSEFHGH